ncbi:MAG: uroporphyrinogen-III synthase, partial [Rhizobacter sp.]
MRVLVTRPAQQAAEWVRDLRVQGLDAVALPLIAIAPVPDAAPLRAAWQTLAQRRLVVFVSPNAAEHFFAARPAGVTWPAGTWAASPGPGTTRALVAAGVPAAQLIEPAADAAQFDSEALWQQLRLHSWQGADVLLVRGDGGRDWLAETLRAHHAQVTPLAAYQRGAPVLDAD